MAASHALAMGGALLRRFCSCPSAEDCSCGLKPTKSGWSVPALAQLQQLMIELRSVSAAAARMGAHGPRLQSRAGRVDRPDAAPCAGGPRRAVRKKMAGSPPKTRAEAAMMTDLADANTPRWLLAALPRPTAEKFA